MQLQPPARRSLAVPLLSLWCRRCSPCLSPNLPLLFACRCHVVGDKYKPNKWQGKASRRKPRGRKRGGKKTPIGKEKGLKRLEAAFEAGGCSNPSIFGQHLEASVCSACESRSMNHRWKGKAERRRVGGSGVCRRTCTAREPRNAKAGGDGDVACYPSTAEVSVQDPSLPAGLCPEGSAHPRRDLQGFTGWKDRGGWDSGSELPLRRILYHHL